MANELKTISVEQIQDKSLIEEVLDAFEDIPFGNSEFQTRAFVIAAQQTPARAYRAIGLEMHSKIEAMKEYLYHRELNKIDVEEKEAKIADPDTSEFDRRRLRLEIMRIQDGERYSNKLANDALESLNILYAEFKRLPRYSRAQFEAEERKHFEKKLVRQIKAPGPLESLENMHTDLPNWQTAINESIGMMQSLEEFKQRLGTK